MSSEQSTQCEFGPFCKNEAAKEIVSSNHESPHSPVGEGETIRRCVCNQCAEFAANHPFWEWPEGSA